MNYKLTKKQAKEMLENRLLHFFGVSTENATNEQYYRAIAMILRDMMTMGRGETVKKSDETGKKNVYYLSMEFLIKITFITLILPILLKVFLKI